MLSILIPVFNVDVTSLVRDLHDQCNKAKVNFEIICFDDFSLDKYRLKNRSVSGLFGVSYIELSENKGRPKIRNLLARNARYENLLFLDCDAKTASKSFVKNYLQYAGSEFLVCGGRTVPKKAPKNQLKYLHWLYGKKREFVKSQKRNKNPVHYFHSNNFMVSRSTIIQIPFNEDISKYGYDDIALAYQMEKAGITLLHFDNPVIHKGFDDFETFLAKIKSSVQNLAELYKKGAVPSTKLIRSYKFLKAWGLTKLVFQLAERQNKTVLSCLSGEKPNLICLDIYKLQVFIQAMACT